jgi:hypothetical protein
METAYTRVSTLLSWVALWALGFARAGVRARTKGCRSWSSLTQLVPPHCHRRNAAERATGNFKEHFVAGISSVDLSFPMHLLDSILPQAEITLNLLRTSRLHLQLSAAAHYRGLVD